LLWKQTRNDLRNDNEFRLPQRRRSTSSRPTLGRTDLRKVDAHRIGPEEYKDAPELTRERLDAGLHEIGGKLVNRGGRPKSEFRKEPVNLRLDPDVLAHYRATGEGWQSRINAALRRAAKLGKNPAQMRIDTVKGDGAHD
jgi:uncharacterized protein (DUF4415 family)